MQQKNIFLFNRTTLTVVLCENAHLHLTSVEAQKSPKLFRLCLKTEMFFADNPAENTHKDDKEEVLITRFFSQSAGLVISDSFILQKLHSCIRFFF